MTREQRRAYLAKMADAALIHHGTMWERNTRTPPDPEFWRTPYDDLRQVCIERGIIADLDAAVAEAREADRLAAERRREVREGMLGAKRKDGGA